MNNLELRKNETFKNIINMAALGYNPYFDNDWSDVIRGMQDSPLTGSDKTKADKILKRVGQHRTLERQKTVLFSMTKDEKSLFIKAFMNLVEGQILDKKPEIQ